LASKIVLFGTFASAQPQISNTLSVSETRKLAERNIVFEATASGVLRS
jgi:hypothetical protein